MSTQFNIRCPNCAKESLSIVSMSYSYPSNDYIIIYKCSKSEDKKKLSLRALLLSMNKSSPFYPDYCPYHQFNPAPFVCAECNQFLCKECYLDHILDEKSYHKSPHPEPVCDKHDNPIISTCLKCNVKVCLSCINQTHLDHCNWEHLKSTPKNLNDIVNDHLSSMHSFFSSTTKKLDDLISKITKIKENLQELYNNFLNAQLPLANIYKILLYNTYSNPNPILNKTINDFEFNFDSLSTKKTNERKEKLDKEQKFIQDSVNIIENGINFVFSKRSFRFNNVEGSHGRIAITVDLNLSKQNSLVNPKRCLKEMKKHSGTVFCLINLHDGNIASCGDDGEIIIWDAYLFKMNVSLLAHSTSINTIIEKKNPGKENEYCIISCSNDGNIKVWNEEDLTLVKQIKVETPVISVYSLPGDAIAGFCLNSLKVFSLTSFQCTYEIKISDANYVWGVHGNYFAAGKVDYSITLFDIFNTSKSNEINLIGNDTIVSAVSIVKTNTIASGNFEGKIMIWDVESGKCITKFEEGHSFRVNAIISLKGGKYIASASNDKTIRIWDLEAQSCVTEIKKAHEGGIKCLLEMNNGALVSGSSDEKIKIWG